MFYYVLNNILHYFIVIKLFINNNICKKKKTDIDYEGIQIINNIRLFDDSKNIEIIKKNDDINKIIENGWYSIKKYNEKVIMLDISYNYNNNNYNILFKYPYKFEFPINTHNIDFDDKILSLTDENEEEIDKIFNKYLGFQDDFYISNDINFSLNDIAIFNNVKISENIIITFYNLNSIQINKNNNLIEIIKKKKE